MSLLWLFSWWKNKYIFTWKYKTSTSYSIYYPKASAQISSHAYISPRKMCTFQTRSKRAFRLHIHTRKKSSGWKQFLVIIRHGCECRRLSHDVPGRIRRWCKIDNENEWSVRNIWRRVWFNAINFRPEFLPTDLFFSHTSFQFVSLLGIVIIWSKEKEKKNSMSKTVITHLIPLLPVLIGDNVASHDIIP